MTNHSGYVFWLKPGMKICQLTFEQLTSPAERPYGHPELGSHYQGQSGPTISVL
jgi:dCTP deaminase